ncbi:MAG TPA: peptidyl-prolyl cis-trans isomerase [Polyangiaceae bacterium]|nr:peptidyl-prolyl cis-trans isomerase [Polyangiaceae bacterium]
MVVALACVVARSPLGDAAAPRGPADASSPAAGALPALVSEARADGSAQPAAPADVVVAKVGDSLITARELNRRLAETPRPTLATYGTTPDEIRKNFLDKVLVREALFAEEAKARGEDKQKDVRDRLLGVLRAALLDDLRKKSGLVDGVSEEDVKAYYQDNIDKFVAPKRIGIARILVDTQKDAEDLIRELGDGEVDSKKWNDLARDKSLDKSSSMRGGNLGLIGEDGATTQPDKRVDPGLFAVADKVKDGELVREPVREGSKWAVVWKRQTMRSVARSIDAVAPDIRSAIADLRMRDAVGKLLEALHKELVSEENPELCDMVSIGTTGDLEKVERPGTLPRTRRPARPAPEESPAGLR